MNEPVLNKSEIQALLGAIGPDEEASALIASFPEMPQPENVDSFEFREEEKSGLNDYPRFSQMHDRFTEALLASWRMNFTNAIAVFFKETTESSYFEVLDSDEPRVYFTMESPGAGSMLVVLDKALVVSYIDALLSGSGEVIPDEETALTPLELKLAGRIASTTASMLADLWSPIIKLDFELKQIDLDPMNLLMTAEDELCFTVTNVIVLGEAVRGEISLCYPFSFLEPMLITMRSQAREQTASIDEEWISQLKSSILSSPIELRLELGRCTIRIQDFLNYKTGDFLPLKIPEREPAKLWIDKYPSFLANPGQQDGMLAAEVLNTIKLEPEKDYD
ncbi:flagellar motor switch protein FliM [Mariprofundus ferrinatatus]|uniref:Flagellar motor switch protein FliM n=1 Tax=Mariprofundus ferrinatatus TaxID=1921087 RepID=A0A2K8LDC3_9PROT|nr:FliM/FliN family flagellar motor switch protein [Mariprofundus ferrinatatus]ATX82904.1 flagellar motor switch protein FliM [Mariprofundus ferrinatatus]